jgi:hypothetical protein
MGLKMNPKGQITIFIILAILIVAGAVVAYVLLKPSGDSSDLSNPESYIRQCIEDNAKDAVSKIYENGGDVNPQLQIQYKGENYTYLCYYQGSYNPCINQRPMLIEHIEKEITSYLTPQLNSCFSNLEADYTKKGYSVSLDSNMVVTTKLTPKDVDINVSRKLSLEKGSNSQSFTSFESKFSSSMYKLSEIAMEVVNQESQYCNFENLGFMITYPQYDIRKTNFDGSLIYTVKELSSQEIFKFAVRGCVMPAGL